MVKDVLIFKMKFSISIKTYLKREAEIRCKEAGWLLKHIPFVKDRLDLICGEDQLLADLLKGIFFVSQFD